MHLEGFIRDLEHEIQDIVTYRFVTNNGELPLNELLGTSITFTHNGKKSCIACGRSVKKLYQGGYCFPCATTLAECDLCIVKPHECHFHKGTCRDPEFGKTHCMIPHYVYLAFSSNIKVGLTRRGRQFKRWVDQGASAAVLVAEVHTRKDAGELEMEIGQYLPDKTDWRKMLRQNSAYQDGSLQATKAEVLERVKVSWQERGAKFTDDTVFSFVYPRSTDFEPNLTSISFDKTAIFTGTLRGVKGQYLLFDEGVMNIRKHNGYMVDVAVSS